MFQRGLLATAVVVGSLASGVLAQGEPERWAGATIRPSTGRGQFKIGDFGTNLPATIRDAQTADLFADRDAGPDHLAGTSWWFRFGDATREQAFAAADVTERTVGTSYANYTLRDNAAGWQATINYEIFDRPGPGGGPGARVVQSVVFRNLSNQERVVDLFNYVDPMVAGGHDLDSATLTQNGFVDPRRTNSITTTDGVWSLDYNDRFIAIEAPFPELSRAWRFGEYAADGFGLTDAARTDWASQTLPVEGDVAGGYQFRMTLNPAGQPGSAVFVATQLILAPSPGAAALMSMAGLVALRRRRC